MAPVYQKIGAKRDHKTGGADLYFALPFDKKQHDRKREKNSGHRHQMPPRERSKRFVKAATAPLHQRGRDGQWPPHARIDAVVDARCHNGPPKGRCCLCGVHVSDGRVAETVS